MQNPANTNLCLFKVVILIIHYIGLPVTLIKAVPIVVLFCFWSANVFALQITGKVIDKETKEALPFASVALSNQHIVTTTDSGGRFRLTLNNPLPGDTLRFSFIGYEKYECGISTLLKKDEILIKLTPKTIVLKEIIIKPEIFDLVKFMKKTAKIYQKERRTDPHIALGYYKEKARIDGTYVMFTESIGYAIFKGDRNYSIESGYAFFCEDTRKSDRHENWLKLAGGDGVGGKFLQFENLY